MTDKFIEKISKMRHSTLLKELEKDYEVYDYIPKKHINRDICRKAVSENGFIINKIPEEFIDDEMCDISIKQTGWAIRYFPKEFQTYEKYLKSVNSVGNVLEIVPKKYINDEMINSSIKGKITPSKLINILLENNNKKEIESYLKTISTKDPYNLGKIPIEYRTKDICEVSTINSFISFQYVPKELKTLKMFNKSIQNMDSGYKMGITDVINNMIEEDFLNKKMSERLIRKFHIIGSIPNKYIDEKDILFHIKNRGRINIFDESLLNKKICSEVFTLNIKNIKDIPEKYQTNEFYDIYMEKLKEDISIFRDISQKYHSKEMYEIAIGNKNDDSLSDLNIKYAVDEEILKESLPFILKNDPLKIIHFLKYLNEELCLVILKKNIENHVYIPEEFDSFVNKVMLINKKTKIKDMNVKKILNKIKDMDERREKVKKELKENLDKLESDDIIF